MNDSVCLPLARQVGTSAFAPDAASCLVCLHDLEVMADIGVFDSEIGVLQPLLIDVTLRIVPPREDMLSHTFDYNHVRNDALALAQERIALIETFAMRLAQRCLMHDVVLEAEVRIGKPRALPGCLAGTCVTVSKRPR